MNRMRQVARALRRARTPLLAVALPLSLGLGAHALHQALPRPDMTRFDNVSVRVADRHGQLLRAFLTPDGKWRFPTRTKDVAPHYLRMLIAYEDSRFYRHGGVDPYAVARAAWQYAANGEIVSGASTLTMQASRLLAARHNRGISGKLRQAARAAALERDFSKEEILSIYLTLAPFGGNIEGVRAASLSWFGKEPRHLTVGEAALLIALPQSPASTRPDRHPVAARAARNKVLTILEQRGVLSASAAAAARAEPLPKRLQPMPLMAPHLARRLAAEEPRRRRHRTTLDARLQSALEALARQELAALDARATVAILVIENETGAVRGYVGSGDFLSTARQGQVDMVTALRSPGSTLKPFIYGMGFDLKLIHPETVVLDRPTSFGQYRPENFMRTYLGEVTVRTALQQSLNVPAVAVLDGVGPERLALRLKQAGASLALPEGKAGLPIALGGVGISMQDLGALYAALARGGRTLALRTRRKETPGNPNLRHLVSAEAAWYLTRILEAAPPPEAMTASSNTTRSHPLAYKTGTSYGFRDAWAVGYDSAHTVVVWVGKPDGTPSPGRYGRVTAAPILYRAFDLLPETPDRRAGPANPERPAGTVVATTDRLPENLRRFAARRNDPMTRVALYRQPVKPLEIAFPPTGAVVDLEKDEKGRLLLPLAAEGGRAPFTWLVNGRPLGAAQRGRQADWAVDGKGFITLTVIDARGRRAVSHVKVR